MKIDINKRYNLPKKVVYCTKCTISNQRPRITFKNGVCNGCHHEMAKNKVDWKKRKKEFIKFLSKFRKNNGDFDCVVPSSGGKDSTIVAYKLKYEYGMNPLTVTWSPNSYTEIGFKNFQNLIKKGIPNILGSPPGDVNRKFVKDCMIEMGDCFQPFIYGQHNFPAQIAIKYNISLVFDGENAEYQYGGDTKSAKKGYNPEDALKYWYSKYDLKFWLKKGYKKKELQSYFPPSIEEMQKAKLQRVFWDYYHKWSNQKHYYFAREKVGFLPNEDRTEGTYSKYASLDDKLDGQHYYFMLLKFGIGRATNDTSQEIREGDITREEGIKLVRKFDDEFPKKNFKYFLDYCDISEDDYWDICEKWRNKKLWFQKNNSWKLKIQVS